MKARGKSRLCRDVAPGSIHKKRDAALKGRNTLFRPFRPLTSRATCNPRGDVLRFASHLPLAIIFRAFGAVLEHKRLNIFRAFGAVLEHEGLNRVWQALNFRPLTIQP